MPDRAIEEPERYLRGIEMPDRALSPQPHTCRCILTRPRAEQRIISEGLGLYRTEWTMSEPVENHCVALVHDGPDNPLCSECRKYHWNEPGFRLGPE